MVERPGSAYYVPSTFRLKEKTSAGQTHTTVTHTRLQESSRFWKNTSSDRITSDHKKNAGISPFLQRKSSLFRISTPTSAINLTSTLSPKGNHSRKERENISDKFSQGNLKNLLGEMSESKRPLTSRRSQNHLMSNSHKQKLLNLAEQPSSQTSNILLATSTRTERITSQHFSKTSRSPGRRTKAAGDPTSNLIRHNTYESAYMTLASMNPQLKEARKKLLIGLFQKQQARDETMCLGPLSKMRSSAPLELNPQQAQLSESKGMSGFESGTLLSPRPTMKKMDTMLPTELRALTSVYDGGDYEDQNLGTLLEDVSEKPDGADEQGLAGEAPDGEPNRRFRSKGKINFEDQDLIEFNEKITRAREINFALDRKSV